MGKSVSSKRILAKRDGGDPGMVEFSVGSLGLRECPGPGTMEFQRNENWQSQKTRNFLLKSLQVPCFRYFEGFLKNFKIKNSLKSKISDFFRKDDKLPLEAKKIKIRAI